MTHVNDADQDHPPDSRLGRVDPFVVGTLLGVFAAVIYTCSNICLRSVANCDPFLVACLKAIPTMVVATGLLVRRYQQRGDLGFVTGSVPILIVAGLAAQLGGNVGFQYALEGCGLALAVPLTLGTLIIGGALLGRVWLGEAIAGRTILALVLLLVAVPVLTWGARDEANLEASAHAKSAGWMWLVGATSACGAGFCYAWQGAVLRRMATSGAPVAATLFILSGVGVLSLGPWTYARIGWAGLEATTGEQWRLMLYAGLFNAIGFFTISRALAMIPVVHMNAINASQAAMAALAGVVLFGEPPTWELLAGVLLTVAGLSLLDRGRRPSDAEG